MKKILLLLLLLALAAGGVVGYLVLTGQTGYYRTDEHVIKKKTHRFFECIKFKEFGEAAGFHDAADKGKVDIPVLIEDLFLVPPEQLDIQEIQVIFAEVDSSGVLAKSKTRCIVQLLNSKEIKKPEVMLYWKKTGKEWYLKLESTLRRKPRLNPRQVQ